MKLYYTENPSGDIQQYFAWYDNDHVLTLDFMDGDIDTWNVMTDEEFEGVPRNEKVYNQAVSRLFIRFLFGCGFNGGEYSDII